MNRYLSTVASVLFLGLMNRPELRAAAPLRQLQQATLVWVLEFKKRKLKLRMRIRKKLPLLNYKRIFVV